MTSSSAAGRSAPAAPMDTPPSEALVWVCDACGFRTSTRFTITFSRAGDSHCCDSCGGTLVCSRCYDHPEFCECTEAPLRTSTVEEPDDPDSGEDHS